MWPLNPDQKDSLKKQINEWLEQGVMEPSISTLGFSFSAMVKKNDGRTDLRELNKQTVKDSYPLTNIQEILHSLQGVTVFSSLDACSAYHVVRIKPESRACTAFISPFQTFQYIWMPFAVQLWAHFGHLTQVNLAHAAAGINIQPCKTKLFQSEEEYLGHRICKDGVLIIPK